MTKTAGFIALAVKTFIRLCAFWSDNLLPFTVNRGGDERQSAQPGGRSGGRCLLGGRAAAAPQRPERHLELQRRLLARYRQGAPQESAYPGWHQPGRRGRAARSWQTERTGRGSGAAAEGDGEELCQRCKISIIVFKCYYEISFL